ncbi:MAG TPA: serine/threonine-protein kinase, partial [Gemmatimonadales bacterium]|nr:serine/threonine-protein kinase [Gemmatimonadales bacterium]
MADPFEQLRPALADRYALERELGRGGMATVYLARDLRHGRPVAIKVLRPEIAAVLGPERFLREIAVAARLTHPHILPLHDSGQAGGSLYYVMPYIEGESLRDRLDREGQLPLEEAVRITREVASALSYAHSHDVVHRDIKPENILLSGGEAVVADFGIARAISAAARGQLTETGIAIGTPGYMSPEQGAASARVDERSDIYSLGCVLYEMLAGEPPFTGPSAESIVRQHLAAAPPRVSAMRAAVPPAIEEAIVRALAKTPADRFATAAEFVEALAAPAQRVGDTGRRTSRLAAGAGLAVTLLAAAAGLFVLSR